jgi:DivIVA domain-containing protein
MLTTDDLISTTFTTTRLREGYEMSEVDEFLVHTTEVLRHRDKEIRALREQVDAGCSTCKDGTPTTPDTGVVEGSRAAARLLEIATRNADELVGEAKAEAAQLTTSARAEADQILAAAREEAERVHAELEQRRVQETADLERQRTTVLSEVTERKAALEAEVSRLQQLEQDHRDRMRSYLNQQLEQLEPTTAG